MATIPASKYEELEKKLEEAKLKIAELERQESSSYFSDSSLADSDERSRRKRRKYKKKRPKSKTASLRKILRQHQEILTKLGNLNKADTEETNEIKALINLLGNTNLKEALKDDDNKINLLTPDMLQPPEISKNSNASSATLRETLQSLRDCFKNTFAGKEEEDLEGYFKAAGKLAEDHKLSKSQFYTLLRSRIQTSCPLYIEIGGHEDQGSSLKMMYNEILYSYGRQNNYVRALHNLNVFKPNTTSQPNEVLTKVKSLVIMLAKTSKTEDIH